MSPIDAILHRAGDPRLAHDQWSRLKPFLVKEKNAERIAVLLGNSRFLPYYLEQHPVLIRRLIEEKDWEQPKNFLTVRQELESRLKEIPPTEIERFQKELCLYKYQEMARIAIRDLSQPLEDDDAGSAHHIGQEWSQVAYALSEQAFKAASIATGINPSGFCVIGLGKMGGGDLNYSSDIDLLYAYDEPDEHESAVRFAGALTKILSEKTDAGFLYRVDLNLRPQGSHGPLVNSLASLEVYYEALAQPWERMVLLKTLPVAGNLNVGHRLIEITEPFVYRKTHDLRIIDEIKAMKEKIHRELPSTSTFNVKLGRGGIREAEFFVHAFQLVYGGNQFKLRKRHTLEALRQVRDEGLIPPDDEQKIRNAYIFLRRVENRLQLFEEQQTHSLPVSPQAKRLLARQMGFAETDLFEKILDQHTRNIHGCFKELAS